MIGLKARAFIGLGIAVAIIAGAFFIHRNGYKSGVTDTVLEYQKADQEGAENVRETSEDVLRRLGVVDDPIRLLCETGGLRDADCDNGGAE